MESVGIVLAMLTAVLVSGTIVRITPLPLPLPLVQIALGILIAAVFEEGVELNPEVFFLLFLPPLLFLDGWRIPKDALRRDWSGIVLLAFGLVFITVLGLGYVIHWMIPAMPLPVSFALAAILSPTDAVAVAGIARKLNVPHHVLSLLEGEALFNDASGLVAFQAAVLATVTGTFALSSAASSFLWVACIGLLSGAATAWAILALRNAFIRRFGEEPGSEILVSLLTPFAAYFVAEWLDASGILAAVAAGLLSGYSELLGLGNATTRIQRRSVWDMVQFTLNGVIFVLLGEQLPGVFQDAVEIIEQTGHHSPWWLPIYAIVICVVLGLLRFAWVYGATRIRGILRRGDSPEPPQIRSLLILSVGGVRGAITLAGVMTLPLVLNSGEPFPGRELAILLAATTIIVSLLAACICLPILLRGTPVTTDLRRYRQHELARLRAHEAATASLHQEVEALGDEAETYAGTVERILANLDDTLGAPAPGELESDATEDRENERRLRQQAVQAARDTIFQLARQGKISDELAREMIQRLDMGELGLY